MTEEKLKAFDRYNYTPLPEPVPITKQEWPEGTLPLVHTRTMTFMHENYIRDCIEGILMQKTTFPVQVLIHDDASTDKTAEIVREYELKYPKLIKAYFQKENTYSKSEKAEKRQLRKIFASWRIGKYEALCEGDDYWTDPLKLQKQVEFMERNEEYAMCYHYNQQRKGDRVLPLLIPRKSRDFSADELIATPDGIATATKLFRNIYIDLRLPIKKPGGDYGLNALLGMLGACKFLPDIKPSIRRLHDGGVWSSKSANSKYYGIINTKIKIYHYFREVGDERRANISLRALQDAIEENLFVLETRHKEFKMGLNRTRLVFKWLKLEFFYRPLLLNIRKFLLRITQRKIS
jgi:glycosyltransferase involved in cell wall biosynthesis